MAHLPLGDKIELLLDVGAHAWQDEVRVNLLIAV